MAWLPDIPDRHCFKIISTIRTNCTGIDYFCRHIVAQTDNIKRTA